MISDGDTEEEDLASLQSVKVEVSSINPEDYPKTQPPPPEDIVSPAAAEIELRDEEEDVIPVRSGGYSVHEIPVTQQVSHP